MAFQPIPREKVLAVIEKLGPVQPLDVRRELREGDTVLIGAILSEMAANGIVAISRTKRGGSPFYYDPRKVEALEMIAQYLGEKDKRTYDLLRSEGVLREDTLEPLTRVSLGNIPDFAKRFTVVSDGTETAFWRHFLISEDDARAKAIGATKPAVERKIEEDEKGPAGKKPRKRAARKPRKQAVEQSTLAPVVDAFADRVKAHLKGAVSDVIVLKPETEMTCVHVAQGPHGSVHTFVYASTKRVTEKAVLKQLLVARGQGMPLLVLTTDEVSNKLSEFFDETPNVHHGRV